MDAAVTDAITLDEGIARLALSPPEGATAKLERYLALLAKWNRVYNLTAVRDPSHMVEQHLLDCLGVVAPLRRWSGGGAKRTGRPLSVTTGSLRSRSSAFSASTGGSRRWSKRASSAASGA